jgi:hypothetical protein
VAFPPPQKLVTLAISPLFPISCGLAATENFALRAKMEEFGKGEKNTPSSVMTNSAVGNY